MNPFTDFNRATIGSRPRGKRENQPIIGLSVNVEEQTSRLHEAYIHAVTDAGGVPLLIPASTDPDVLRKCVETIDGLILTGGGDVDGRYFGESTLVGIETDPLRDAYDFLLLRLAADRQIPILGICRGMQVINIAFGGSIWQDIPSQYPGQPLDHRILSPREKTVHPVSLIQGSTLGSVFGKNTLDVNSRHHQAVKKIAQGFHAVAFSPDGIVEALEGTPYRIWGVQWHPENLAAEANDKEMKTLFRFFISEADLYRKSKQLHDNHLIIDSHCDTPMLFGIREYVPELTRLMQEAGPLDIGRRHPFAQVDLAKMAEGRLDAAFMAAYIPQGIRDDDSRQKATEEAIALFEALKQQIYANSAYAGLALTFDDVQKLKQDGRKALFLGLENGFALGVDLENIRRFRDMGVAYITLCHNGANDLCDSAAGEPEHGGLSALGREAVHEMNRLGMAVDLSHAAETTFYDVLRESRAPVICSHSSARALCDHPRNLSDKQLHAMAENGGVVQVCLYHGFLASGHEATLTDAVNHIDHIVQTAGIDHVGIGSDFDGGGGIPGCNGANELINITVELFRRGYTEEEIAKIWGGNLCRVLNTGVFYTFRMRHSLG